MYNFIHIPKVAGSSLYSMIGGNSLGYLGHIRAIDTQFFAFTRNPYDRLVDAYVYLIKGGGQTELDLSYQLLLQKYSGFNEFVLNIEKDNLIEKIIHIKPMTWFLCDDENRIVVQKIFKIEEPDNIDEFLATQGYGKLSEVMINITERAEFYSYLTEENLHEINRIYRNDFLFFNYDRI